MEAIILAGGLGTRLQGVIGQYPKCMAAVNNKPFLAYLLIYLEAQGCKRVVLSLGFKHEVITEWLAQYTTNMEITWVIEHEPMGTGGGIQLAIQAAKANDVVILNGDTMFRVDLNDMLSYHAKQGAAATLALKEMYEFERYGVVNTDAAGVVTSFEEKQYRPKGMINGGVYVVNRAAFLAKGLPQKFSMEKDYLEKYTGERKFYGYTAMGYFIDIGIPEDYAKAQEDFKSELI